MAPRYARALAILAEIQKYDIVHLRDRFDPATKDVDWIQELSEESDWVIVSGDPRISRGKEERKAWHESGLTAFFFGDKWASRSYWKQATDIVGWWSEIVLTAKSAPQGSGFLIPLKGKAMKQIYKP